MRAARSDEQLARAAGRGDVAAFEALYQRHHRALLSFSRHMLGRAHDAEDVVQHTFLAADRAFRGGKVPKAVRPWLYTVARNRCVSLLRARREDAGLPDAGVPSTENLVADVEQREDLRALLSDLRALPDDQRAALLLAELGDFTHAEVAKVIGVRTGKVKALVFQAREGLLASAHAREIPCHSIREDLANATGAALRRRHLRNHLEQCESCRAFAADVRAQRAALGLLLPVVPTLALRDGVLAGLASGGAAAGAGAGAGIGAGVLANSTAAKLLATIAIGGAAAGGGIVVTKRDAPERQPAEPKVERVGSAPAAVAPGAAAPPTAERPGPAPARETTPVRGRAGDPGARRSTPRAGRDAPRARTPGEPASANGHGRDSAPGQLKAPREKDPKVKPPQANGPKTKAPKPAKVKPPKVNAPKPTKVKAPKPETAPKPQQVKPPKPEPNRGEAAPPQAGAVAPRDPRAEPPAQVDTPPGQARKG